MPESTHNRTFRVFISSTFADFKKERDELQTRVFPGLKALCERSGFRFQAIDLRWGVTEEAGLDQQTARICLEELRRCMASGLRPALLILLGQRNGWHPLPESIEAGDFSAIARHLEAHDPPSSQLLHQWYLDDCNAAPVRWLLRPRTGRFQSLDVWQTEVEIPLRRALTKSCSEVRVSEPLRIACERSLTEREIRTALEDDGSSSRAIAFLRAIAGSDPLPEPFRDPGEDVDGSKAENLRRLWADVESSLGPNCLRATTGLTNGEVTGEYLDHFCEVVGKQLEMMARAEIDERRRDSESGQAEIDAHGAFAAERGRLGHLFAGRDNELSLIRRYVTQPAAYPLVVVGAPGSGKSALLARACADAARDPERVVIQRYLGATAESTDERLLLRGICAEFDRYYDFSDPIPENYNDLVSALRKRLEAVPADRPLVLVLDALNQLQLPDPQQVASLVPARVPTAVRIIVSVTEESGPMREAIKEYCRLTGQEFREPADFLRMRFPNEAFLSCGDLGEPAAEMLVDDWLTNRHHPRRLQPSQRQAIIDGFRRCPSPLYLKIATEEAALLRSNDPPPIFPESVSSLCKMLFMRLSQPERHMPRLVERVFGYLRSAIYGLSETEILELLASDAGFMEEFRRRTASVGQKISAGVEAVPLAIWARLAADLQPYFVERAMDGIMLWDFFHREMDVAAGAWLAEDVRAECQAGLVTYFAGQETWEDSLDLQREKLLSVPPRPRKANLRKILELPPLLMKNRQSRQTLKESIFDPDLLEALCESGRIQSLVDTIRVSCRYHGQEELSRWNPDGHLSDMSLFRFAMAVMNHRDFLQRHPTTLYQTLSIFFRFSNQWKEITAFLERWKLHKDECTPGFPHVRYISGPPLHDVDTSRTLTFRHSAPITSLAVSPTESYIACGDHEGGLRLYRVMDGKELWSTTYKETVNYIVYSPGGNRIYAACWEGDSVREIDTLSGAEIRILGRLGDVPLSLAISPDGTHLAAGCADRFVYVWRCEDGCLLHKLAGHRDGVMSVCFAMDGKYLASGGRDDQLLLWDMPSGDLVARTDEQGWSVEALCLLSDGRHIASAHAGGSVAVWEIPTLKRVVTKQICRAGLSCIAATQHSQNKIFNMSAFNGLRLVPKWKLPILPYGAELRDGLSDWIIVGSDDTCFYLWRPSSDAVEQFMGHTSHVIAVAWDSGSPILSPVTGSHDQTISLWGYPEMLDNREHGPGGRHTSISSVQSQSFGMHYAWCVPDSGLFMAHFFHPGRYEKLLVGDRPFCCDFLPCPGQDPVLAVGTEFGKLKVLSPGHAPLSFDLGSPVRNVRFSPMGSYLGIITATGLMTKVIVVAYPEFHLVATTSLYLPPGQWLSEIAVHPEGNQVAVGGKCETVRVFSIEVDADGKSTLTDLWALDAGGRTIVDLDYDLTGNILVGMPGSVGGATISWDTRTGEVVRRDEGEIHPRALTSTVGENIPRARCLETEVVFEVPVPGDGREFQPIAWLASSMSWVSHDFTGSMWVGLEGQHVCVVELVRDGDR